MSGGTGKEKAWKSERLRPLNRKMPWRVRRRALPHGTLHNSLGDWERCIEDGCLYSRLHRLAFGFWIAFGSVLSSLFLLVGQKLV
jgi:hypothetical protein